MNTKKEIDDFFNGGRIAFIGLSGNPKKFSNMVFKELSQKGIEFVPVNPKMTELDGVKCYENVASLPDDVKSALIMTPKSQTPQVLREIGEKGLKNIWIQQGAHSAESHKVASELDINLVHNKCIMMYAGPVKGVHKFHRAIIKLFGRLSA